MKTRSILVGIVLTATVVVLSGCGWLTGMADTERAKAFIETANASPRDYEEMQSHWSSSAESYASMVTEQFWNETVFRDGEQPFEISDLRTGDDLDDYPEATTLQGTLTTDVEQTGVPITFGFVPEETNPLDRVIRVIIIDGGIDDEIQSIR
ncbi:MAG: hypothetical protein ACOCZB_04920 [Spirochaetota bacterium]